MATDNTFMRYVGTMMEYRELYNSASTTTARNDAAEKIKILRYQAHVEGVDIYELEREVYVRINGSDPPNNWAQQFHVSAQETILTKQLNDIKDYYETASDIERPKLHQQAQMARMQMYALGLDLYAIEDRAHLLRKGEDISGEYRTGQHQHVADAIAMYNSSNDKRSILDTARELPISEKNRVKSQKFNFGERFGEVFSGSDMVVFMAFPGYKPLEVGVASTVTYTSYREKKQIRTLGRISAKGITKGPRTISGRLIFTVLNEHIVESLRKEIPYLRDKRTIMMDELPSFDILVSFGNEYGAASGLVIQGITVVDEQKVLSIEDLFTENVFTYIARALEPMRGINATNINEPYDPLEWFTSSFAPETEKLGKFKPKELQLYRDAQLLPDSDPFYGYIAGWDSAKYNLATGYGTPFITDGYAGDDSGGSSGGSGSGNSERNVNMKVFDAIETIKPVSNVKIESKVGSRTVTATTNATGSAQIKIDVLANPPLKFSKEGYNTLDTFFVFREGTGEYDYYIQRRLSGEEADERAKYTAKTAVKRGIYASPDKGSFPLFKNFDYSTYENPSVDKRDFPIVRAYNEFGNWVANVPVDWSWENMTYDTQKKNDLLWGAKELTNSYFKKTGEFSRTFTSSTGSGQFPRSINMGKFPKNSSIRITATVFHRPTDKLEPGEVNLPIHKIHWDFSILF